MSWYCFLDDIRFPSGAFGVDLPLVDWTIVRNYKEFTFAIAKNGLPKFVSFDCDLAPAHYYDNPSNVPFDLSGKDEPTGVDCAKWLVEYCRTKKLKLPEYTVHSLNGKRKAELLGLLKKYERECVV